MQLPILCSCALKLLISWLCQNLSILLLNVFVVLADTTQLSKLFQISVDCILHQISEVSHHFLQLHTYFLSFIQGHIWMIFSSNYLVHFDHISPYMSYVGLISDKFLIFHYGKFFNTGIILVALFCTFSKASISRFLYGAQKEGQ